MRGDARASHSAIFGETCHVDAERSLQPTLEEKLRVKAQSGHADGREPILHGAELFMHILVFGCKKRQRIAVDLIQQDDD